MAGSKCRLIINGNVHSAAIGDTLIDAGLSNRIVLPHDCCSGQCETCRVRVVSGAIDDAGTREKDSVLGCLATLEGDAEIAFDPVPHVRSVRGETLSISDITPGLKEVRILTTKPVPWLPGQYVRLQFKGYPARDYSPTFRLDLGDEQNVLVFQVKIYEGGRLSSALGSAIRQDYPVTVKGPFGNAYLRRRPERLVLASTGTGFAPLWSIAVSARMRDPEQRIVLIAGARYAEDLYMREAISWLRQRGCGGGADGIGWRRSPDPPGTAAGSAADPDGRRPGLCGRCAGHGRCGPPGGAGGRCHVLCRSLLCRGSVGGFVRQAFGTVPVWRSGRGTVGSGAGDGVIVGRPLALEVALFCPVAPLHGSPHQVGR